jgi:excisionase family DNA binding protein
MHTETHEISDISLFLLPVEAARLLRISRSRVYELVRAGELPYRKIGQLIRIPRAAIEKMALEAATASGTEQR